MNYSTRFALYFVLLSLTARARNDYDAMQDDNQEKCNAALSYLEKYNDDTEDYDEQIQALAASAQAIQSCVPNVRCSKTVNPAECRKGKVLSYNDKVKAIDFLKVTCNLVTLAYGDSSEKIKRCDQFTMNKNNKRPHHASNYTHDNRLGRQPGR